MKHHHFIRCAATTTAFLLFAAVAARAGSRDSADYDVSTDIIDAGGARTASANYTNDASFGSVAGVSAVATPEETIKHGYLGQLFEVTGLALSSDPPAILDEETTAQLAAWHLLDDATFLALPATAVLWHQDGTFPLTINHTTGLATASAVYQDTATTVTATQGEIPNQLTAELDLTVRDTDPDNYGLYAGDQLDDLWQFLYFGLNNPDAFPGKDPDGDGQNNQFEFTAGVVPNNPLSRFLLRIEPVAGQPTHKRLIFSPRFEDRSYEILTSTSLSGDTWTALPGGMVTDDGDERTVTDPNATEGAKFYRVEISRP